MKAENTDGGAVVDPEAGGLGLATGNHANHAMYVLCNIHYRLRVGLSGEHFYSLNLALTASQPTVALSQITHHYSCFLVPSSYTSRILEGYNCQTYQGAALFTKFPLPPLRLVPHLLLQRRSAAFSSADNAAAKPAGGSNGAETVTTSRGTTSDPFGAGSQ